MRLLLINNGYPTSRNPKHSSYLKNIHLGLISAGYKVELLVLNSNFEGRLQQFKEYLIFYLKIIFKSSTSYDLIFLNHFAHYAIPLLFRMFYKKKLVIHWHGEDLLPQSKLKKIYFSIIFKTIPKRALHITPSNYYKKILQEKLHIPERRIIVSPSGGIHEERFIPVSKPKNEGSVTIGFSSSLDIQKGVEYVINLLQNKTYLEKEINKNICFHYIYYGKEKKKFSSKIEAIENTFRWNILPAEKMPEFFNSIDILLFPTHRESLGLVALEAMFCNIPVVGSDIFPLKEYILPGISGELFSLKEKNSIIDAVLKCSKNISNYNPRDFVLSQYSFKKVTDDYMQLYNLMQIL